MRYRLLALVACLLLACGEDAAPTPPEPAVCGYCDPDFLLCDDARLVGTERTGYDWACWIRTRLDEGYIRGSCVTSGDAC